ncbi:OmpA family protein [Thioalkalivibrio sp. XN279]|uniref:OmpA family protein n=1 Tax=Thioalkalivibrio sp. XN279 TaxID=2714953 RepID=UPI00140A2267|nr:OmpA family protein [Thioalkalivibrio sp. XN279]NHA13546.1 OmpA family protein [Thioalkalivibrio sp. XN279]
MNKTALGLAVAAALSIAIPATALAAQGDVLLRVGASSVQPKDDNLVLAPGVVLQVDDDDRFTFDVTYMFRDHWGIELLASDEWNHGFTVPGAGISGYVEHLPPTLSLQYHFLPESRIRPYVGAGLNYTIFSNETSNAGDLNLRGSFGPAVQAGVDIGITENIFLNGVVRWIDIDSDASLNGADIGTIEIDPIIYGIHLGYRFGRPAPVVAAAPVAAAPPPPPPAPPPPPPPPPPADTDGDGVPDSVDRCPTTPAGARVDQYGCSCDFEMRLTFEFGSAALSAADKAMLDEIIPTLRDLTFIRGTISGHTDSVGPEAFNQQLSERRAQAVKDYLVANGVPAQEFGVIGFGETMPVASNDTDEGRALNRRVVLERVDCD